MSVRTKILSATVFATSVLVVIMLPLVWKLQHMKATVGNTCQISTDCSQGEWCGQDGYCHNSCGTDSMCATGKVCTGASACEGDASTCGVVDGCTWHSDQCVGLGQADCEALNGCRWGGGTSCNSVTDWYTCSYSTDSHCSWTYQGQKSCGDFTNQDACSPSGCQWTEGQGNCSDFEFGDCIAHNSTCSWMPQGNCASFNGNQSGCQNTTGCTWDAQPCSTWNGDQGNCEGHNGNGCAWHSYSCGDFGFTDCGSNPGCSWGNDYTSCSGLDHSGCDASSTQGCSWSPISCNCSDISDKDSCNSNSCMWSDGSDCSVFTSSASCNSPCSWTEASLPCDGFNENDCGSKSGCSKNYAEVILDCSTMGLSQWDCSTTSGCSPAYTTNYSDCGGKDESSCIGTSGCGPNYDGDGNYNSCSGSYADGQTYSGCTGSHSTGQMTYSGCSGSYDPGTGSCSGHYGDAGCSGGTYSCGGNCTGNYVSGQSCHGGAQTYCSGTYDPNTCSGNYGYSCVGSYGNGHYSCTGNYDSYICAGNTFGESCTNTSPLCTGSHGGSCVQCVNDSQCSGSTPSCHNNVCVATCGNGAMDTGEACDDGNTTSGDGCSSTCTVESGWECSGTPSACSFDVNICGNGKIDQWATFDGTDSYVSLGENNSLASATSSGFTVSAWLKVSNPSRPNSIISAYQNNGGGFDFVLNDYCTGVSLSINGIVNQCVQYTFQPDIWYNVVAVQQNSGGTMQVEYYVNGQFIGSSPTTAEYASSLESEWRIGSQQYWGFFQGNIRDVMVFARPIGREEIGDIIAAGESKAAYAGPSAGSLILRHFSSSDVGAIGVSHNVTINTEACDDGNQTTNDGCSADCFVETGFDCTSAEPSVCTPTPNYCHANTDCSNPHPICSDNQCAVCHDNADCGTGKVCDMGSCFAGDCRTGDDCANPKPSCASHVCTACTSNVDCYSPIEEEVCDSGSCFAGDCVDDSDCVGSANGPNCIQHLCLTCGQGQQCAQGKICDAGVCHTGNCVTADTCQSGQQCIGYTCVTPDTSSSSHSSTSSLLSSSSSSTSTSSTSSTSSSSLLNGNDSTVSNDVSTVREQSTGGARGESGGGNATGNGAGGSTGVKGIELNILHRFGLPIPSSVSSSSVSPSTIPIHRLSSRSSASSAAIQTAVPMTRAEAIHQLLQQYGVPVRHTPVPFIDVTRNTPYADDIGTAAKLGIVRGDRLPNGRARGTVRPNDPITESELAVLVQRLQNKDFSQR